MGEEVKKPKHAPDPNSAKYKLNAIVEKHYREVQEAKDRGEKIGWCASNFPQEIFQTLGIKVCYPENQAAAIDVYKRQLTNSFKAKAWPAIRTSSPK